MPPFRLIFTLLLTALGLAANAAGAEDEPCRKAFVVPYADQCAYVYSTLKKDTSPANLSAAFDACGRAQTVAVGCVRSADRNFHAVALGALYQDVTQQAEIALFAQQFAVAKALLTEKLQVIAVIARDRKPGDPRVAEERASATADLADAGGGLCTQTTLASSGDAPKLAHEKKYADLATFLHRKADDYARCARMAPTLSKRAYLEYVGFVALEEGARAAQASGDRGAADDDYRACIAGAAHAGRYALAPVSGYLATIGTLCAGRMSGRYSVDQPAPLDAPDAKGFRPLVLPKG